MVGRVKAINCDLCSYITVLSNDASQKKREGVSVEPVLRLFRERTLTNKRNIPNFGSVFSYVCMAHTYTIVNHVSNISFSISREKNLRIKDFDL